ncbi:MAG: nitroreductase family deazaflavin-dependent oxidoreductase [Anaerolineales bacterium]
MANWIKFFTSANAFLFRITGGRLGNRMGGQSVLLLHTIGRKSGKPYTTPLSYYRDGNAYLVVASNWGKEAHSAWFFNLLQQPRTTIQVGSTTIPVEARAAEGEEYNRLWILVTRQNDQYVKYQAGLARKIPIVILTPTASA